MKKIVLGAIALTLPVAAAAAPGDTDTAKGTATATVVAPIELEHDADAALAFGSFLAGAGGTVVVTSAGAGSVTGEVEFVSGSTNSADSFTVSGDARRSFSISATGSTVSNGTATMAFTTSVSAASDTLDTNGDGSFTVGGTLTVAADQAAGDYTGTYDATVAYN